MAVLSRSGLSAVRDKCICNIWRLVEPEKPSCPFVFHMRLKTTTWNRREAATIPGLYAPEMEASFLQMGRSELWAEDGERSQTSASSRHHIYLPSGLTLHRLFFEVRF